MILVAEGNDLTISKEHLRWARHVALLCFFAKRPVVAGIMVEWNPITERP